MCKEKVFTVFANLVIGDTLQEKIDVTRQIPITSVRRIGIYNLMRCRPLVVSCRCRSDVEYLLENK